MNFICINQCKVRVNREVSRAKVFSRIDRYTREVIRAPLVGLTKVYDIFVEIVTFQTAIRVPDAFRVILGSDDRRFVTLLELLAVEAQLQAGSATPIITSSHGIRFHKVEVYGTNPVVERELMPIFHFENGVVGPGTRFVTALLTDVEKCTYDHWLDRLIPDWELKQDLLLEG
jgi:hypothetical protein